MEAKNKNADKTVCSIIPIKTNGKKIEKIKLQTNIKVTVSKLKLLQRLKNFCNGKKNPLCLTTVLPLNFLLKPSKITIPSKTLRSLFSPLTAKSFSATQISVLWYVP
jgi:hypothetical protein